ncbi:hypothetical protein [Paenibacillus sp. YAF4_2]|uniref:hypothetical protein n=1 Tax=Paenibacillus sp. YAF4_2 TaxID=3233085 RepID=UPI003F98507C
MIQVLWKKSARHLVLPALVIALLLIGSQFMQVDADRDKGTFYLKDHQGDRSALADVTISGELGDGFHKSSFELAGSSGSIATDTQIYDSPKNIWYDDRTPDKLKGDLKFDLNGFEPFAIDYWDQRDSSIYKTAYFTLEFVEYNDKHQTMHNSHTFTNSVQYGLAKIGNQIYFTVPSGNTYVGTNGIYKLNFIDGRSNPADAPESEALATYSLDKNKEPASSEIQVLGLEAVGDKLALILEENKKLVVRSYDSRSGKLLGEAAANNFTIPSSHLGEKKRSFHEDYEAFIDEDQLSIAFRSTSDESNNYGSIQKTIWSFNLSDGVKLLDETTISYNDSIELNKRNMKAISYRNGKLYVVHDHSILDGKTDEQILFDPYRPKQLIIQVYQAGKLLYEGELATDMNDDWIRAMNYTKDSFTNDTSQYRTFDHIVIQWAKGAC